mgnify:CR=1 FL=1
MNFYREMRERRVLPAVGVYIGACWVVIEILDRLTDRADEQIIRDAPVLAYLNPGRFAAIDDSFSFPFPAGMKK